MQINPYRTITLWSLWATVTIITYLTLYIDAKIWEFMENDPSRITWLIMVLFVFGVVSSFALSLVVTKEGVCLRNIQITAQKKGLSGIDQLTSARTVLRFFKSIRSTLDADGQPDVELLSHIELAFFHRVSHGVEVVGNLLITLGLIGTVIGLTLTLTGLTNSLEALGQDQEMLLSGLQRAMAGMGTAFYTTLLGAVLGGVLLRVFAQIADNGVKSLHDMMMRICLVYCSADYKPSLGRELRFLNTEMRTLENNIKNMETAFSSSRNALEGFKGELAQFSKGKIGDGEKGETLETTIRRHMEYCQVLREEARLINAVNNSWWARLKMVFGIYK